MPKVESQTTIQLGEPPDDLKAYVQKIEACGMSDKSPMSKYQPSAMAHIVGFVTLLALLQCFVCWLIYGVGGQ